MDYCECIVLSTGHAHLTSIVLIQVRTAMSMRHAARWFQQESRSGWTPAPSVAAMMARMLVTGRETVWPPARASKTARLKRRPPRKTDWLGTSRAHTQYHIKTTTISIVERMDWIVNETSYEGKKKFKIRVRWQFFMVNSDAASVIAEMTKLANDEVQLHCKKGLRLNISELKLTLCQDMKFFCGTHCSIWSSSCSFGTNSEFFHIWHPNLSCLK